MKKIAIIGAGGFARELRWLIEDIAKYSHANETSQHFTFVGFVVSDLSKLGAHDSQAAGDLSWLRANSVDAVAIGIGNPQVRSRIGAEIKEHFPDIELPALIHPSVRYDKSCVFGEGSIVCAGCIATVNVSFGPFSMVNLSCTIGHETVVGEGTVINPLCAISGGVKIGKRVLIGTHASVLQYVSIGDDSVIGSGAMANKDIASGVTAMGVPARARLVP